MKDYYDDYVMTREDPAADLPGHTEPVIEDPVNEEELDEDYGYEGAPGGDYGNEEEPAGIYRYRDLFIAIAAVIAIFIFCATAFDYEEEPGTPMNETEMTSETIVSVTGKDGASQEPQTETMVKTEIPVKAVETAPEDGTGGTDRTEITSHDNTAVSDAKWQEKIFGGGESMAMTMQIQVQGLTENERTLTGFRESDFIKKLSVFLSANNISTRKVTFSGPAACSAISGAAYEAALSGIKDRKLVVVFYPEYPGQYLFCLVKDEKEKTTSGNTQTRNETQAQNQTQQPQAQVQQTQPQTTAVQSTQPETQPEYDAMRLSVKNVSGELSNYLASTYDLQYSLYDYLFHHGIRNAKTARVTSYYIDPEERTASIEISVEGAGNVTAIYDRDANSYSFQ